MLPHAQRAAAAPPPLPTQPAACCLRLPCPLPPLQIINESKAWMEGKEVRGRIYFSEQVGRHSWAEGSAGTQLQLQGVPLGRGSLQRSCLQPAAWYLTARSSSAGLQGVNAQFGGVREDAEGFAKWLSEKPLFKVKTEQLLHFFCCCKAHCLAIAQPGSCRCMHACTRRSLSRGRRHAPPRRGRSHGATATPHAAGRFRLPPAPHAGSGLRPPQYAALSCCNQRWLGGPAEPPTSTAASSLPALQGLFYTVWPAEDHMYPK